MAGRIGHKVVRLVRRQYHRVVSLVLTLALLMASFPLNPVPAIAAIGDLTQQDYRWYQNADAVQPTVALAAENTAVTGGTHGTVYRLRMNMDHPGATLDPGAAFKLHGHHLLIANVVSAQIYTFGLGGSLEVFQKVGTFTGKTTQRCLHVTTPGL